MFQYWKEGNFFYNLRLFYNIFFFPFTLFIFSFKVYLPECYNIGYVLHALSILEKEDGEGLGVRTKKERRKNLATFQRTTRMSDFLAKKEEKNYLLVPTS